MDSEVSFVPLVILEGPTRFYPKPHCIKRKKYTYNEKNERSGSHLGK